MAKHFIVTDKIKGEGMSFQSIRHAASQVIDNEEIYDVWILNVKSKVLVIAHDKIYVFKES